MNVRLIVRTMLLDRNIDRIREGLSDKLGPIVYAFVILPSAIIACYTLFRSVIVFILFEHCFHCILNTTGGFSWQLTTALLMFMVFITAGTYGALIVRLIL